MMWVDDDVETHRKDLRARPHQLFRGGDQVYAEDVGTLMMYGYGNDWYVIAIDLPTGALVTTRSLGDNDTFGAQTPLRPNGHQATASSSALRIFQLALPMDDGVEGVAMTNAFVLPVRSPSPSKVRRSRRCSCCATSRPTSPGRSSGG